MQPEKDGHPTDADETASIKSSAVSEEPLACYASLLTKITPYSLASLTVWVPRIV